MRRGEDEFELTPLLGCHVDGSIGHDVRFDALDEPEGALLLGVDGVDVGVLLAQLGHRRAARDLETVRVVGESAVCIAAFATRVDDLVQRLAAVAPYGMHLQIAAIRRSTRSRERSIREDAQGAGAAQEVASQ
jgi:hypothetical protein